MEYYPEFDVEIQRLYAQQAFDNELKNADMEIRYQRYSTDIYLLSNELIWKWKHPDEVELAHVALMSRGLDIPNFSLYYDAVRPKADQLIAFLRLDADDQQALIQRLEKESND